MVTELVVLDLAGTTVADGGLVESAFTEAITAAGVSEADPRFPDMLRYVRDTMGQSKIEVFRALLDGDETLAGQANSAFERAYGALVGKGFCVPVDGAEAAIRQLRESGARVAFSTGFAKSTMDAILDALGWTGLADLAIAPGDGVRGRPLPDLVLAAALRLGVSDVAAIAVAGDTPADMCTGRRAGAGLVAGVLTGAGDRAGLTAAGATHVLDSVRDLPATLTKE